MQDKIFLFDTIPENNQLPDGKLISVSQTASVELLKLGVPFNIPDDFMNLDEYYLLMPKYIKLLDEWLDLVDNEISSKYDFFKSSGIKPARLYGYWLGWIIGTFVTQSIFINKIITKCNSNDVHYFTHNFRTKPVNIKLWKNLWEENTSIYSTILDYLSETKIINLNKVFVPFIPKENNREVDNFFNIRKRILDPLYNFSYYKLKNTKYYISKVINLLRRKEQVIFLHEGWGLGKINSQFRKKGFRTILLSNENKSLYPLAETVDINNDIQLNKYYDYFDEFIGFGISEILKDRLDLFFNELIPNLENQIKLISDYFKKSNTKAVICCYKYSFLEHAFLGAALLHPNIVSAQVMHGYSALDMPFNFSLSEEPCKLYIAVDNEIADYFRNDVFRDKQTKVQPDSLWASSFQDIQKKRYSNINDLTKSILYVPALYNDDIIRMDEYYYSNNWYILFHYNLLKYFGSLENYRIIWKAPHKSSQRIVSPIPELIDHLGLKNIEYTEGNLIKKMQFSDCAVIDYPSSYLYEIVAHRLPVLCVYHKSMKVRESAKKRFGDILQPFCTFDEAKEKIDYFLESDKCKYLIDKEHGQSDACKIIKENLIT